MPDSVVCLDTGVLIKFLVPEEPEELNEAAAQIVRRALQGGHIIAPVFAWAEVGTVLRKKVRQQLLTNQRADQQWHIYLQLPIQFIDHPALRQRTWEIAQQFGLLTLYDASFLACTEVALAPITASREFWTTDAALVRALANDRPHYVRLLGTDRE